MINSTLLSIVTHHSQLHTYNISHFVSNDDESSFKNVKQHVNLEAML